MFGSVYDWLWWICVILYVPACLGLIAVVLLQKGKGVGFAGAFGLGGGGADTVFGPRMSKSLPVKLTYVMAGMFLVLALGMSLLSGRIHRGEAPEMVPAETVDMSAYEEAGIGVAPEAETPETPAVVLPGEGELEMAPVEEVEGGAPVEPSAENVDEPIVVTPADIAGEASPPAEQ